MENTANNTEQAEQSAEPHKHSLGARILVAYGVSGIGAKLGSLGIPFDSKNLFEGENLSLKQKFSLFRETLKKKLNLEVLRDLAGTKDPDLGLEELKKIALQNNPDKSTIVKANLKAIFKLSKFTTGLALAGSIIGAVIGWKRGGLIEDWHDTVKHPIDSTKVILGFAKPEILDKYRTSKKDDKQKQPLEKNTVDATENGNAKNWASTVKESPASKADGVLSARNEAAASPSLG